MDRCVEASRFKPLVILQRRDLFPRHARVPETRALYVFGQVLDRRERDMARKRTADQAPTRPRIPVFGREGPDHADRRWQDAGHLDPKWRSAHREANAVTQQRYMIHQQSAVCVIQ